MARIPKRILKKARIEIIPLIDVIFFLLATFVLFTLSLNRIQSIPIDLPEAVVVPNKDRVEPVTIQVSDANTLYWDHEPITLDDLTGRLANYVANEPDPRVLVAGDELALFGPTVQVLDEVRKAGIEKVSIETRVRRTGQ
jgi:biopolymer transport protein ExbD